jgi:peptidyl-prolyl cis-trans isomerase A (cyclophilin A)
MLATCNFRQSAPTGERPGLGPFARSKGILPEALLTIGEGLCQHPFASGGGETVSQRISASAVVWLVAVAGNMGEAAPPPVLVTMRTEMGDIVLEVETDRAPISAANFLRYVDAGRYEGGGFHRSVRLDNQPGKSALIEVVQAGVKPEWSASDYPPIPLERTSKTGLRHADGTLSMARDGPDSATSDFFICIGDQPSLDFSGKRNPDGQGFAAFGRVIKGMDVVRRIQRAPTDGQRLTPPILILSARRGP